MKTTNNHEGELVLAYDTNAENITLCSRTLYVLYIGPNDNGNSHLIFKLSTNQILVTVKYQPIHVPEDLMEAINEIDSSNNKIKVNHFNSDHSIIQENRSNNNKHDGQNPRNDKDNSEAESHGKLDSSQQINDMEANKIVNQEN